MLDYKKEFKTFYLPKNAPELIDLPEMTFAMIEGEGDPNGSAFTTETEALYGFSYAVKMSYKGMDKPEGYYEYTVFPLEGEWDLIDKSKELALDGRVDKSNLKYRIMIRQPEFVTQDVFEFFIGKAKKKKPNACFDRIQLITIKEGLCCQMLHIGSYDDEANSFTAMEAYCEAQGHPRHSKRHREIYLSDPRKTANDKLKTVLRFKVAESFTNTSISFYKSSSSSSTSSSSSSSSTSFVSS